MRLWHYKLIPYLPNSQILAQWRELNSIFKKQDKHILINYIYEYDYIDLYCYSLRVINELDNRKIKHNNSKMLTYFEHWLSMTSDLTIMDFIFNNKLVFKNHHTDRYLKQCFYNLQEKYDRGQKDFTEDRYKKLEEFAREAGILNECN